MRMYAFHCGFERADAAAFDPFDPLVGTPILIPYFFYLIRHPEGDLLFDTGVHPGLKVDPEGRAGLAAAALQITLRDGDDVVSQLDRLGLAPSTVTHVAHSHLHYDHCGGIEFLPDAQFYIQKAELQFAHWPPVYQRGMYFPADFNHPVAWKELDGEYDLFNDGRLVLFPTPGHTPGHQSLLVKLDGRTIILVGDAAYTPEKMAARAIPPGTWSPDAMVASWERIEERQRRTNAELMFSHDLHYEHRIRRAPEEWYE
jgi:N-acyl homoserine lactone hydrolase